MPPCVDIEFQLTRVLPRTGCPLGRPRPHALAVLYLQLLPLQCRQCGLRQPESRTGKRKMDEHLDWHFVHKRRMREAAGRASGRSWFTSEEVRSSLSSILFP